MSLLELHTPAVGTTGDIYQALCVVKSDPRKQKLRLLRLQETAIVALTEQRYQDSEKRVCVFVLHKRAKETYVHNIIIAQVFCGNGLNVLCVMRCTFSAHQAFGGYCLGDMSKPSTRAKGDSSLATSSGHILHT